MLHQGAQHLGEAIQVQRGGMVRIEIGASVIAGFGAVVAHRVEAAGRSADQVEKRVASEWAAEASFAQFPQKPRTLGTQPLIVSIAAKCRDNLVAGSSELARKPIAGEGAGASQQYAHMRGSPLALQMPGRVEIALVLVLIGD